MKSETNLLEWYPREQEEKKVPKIVPNKIYTNLQKPKSKERSEPVIWREAHRNQEELVYSVNVIFLSFNSFFPWYIAIFACDTTIHKENRSCSSHYNNNQMYCTKYVLFARFLIVLTISTTTVWIVAKRTRRL